MVADNLLVIYVYNNLGLDCHVHIRNNPKAKICGYNLKEHQIIFGYTDRFGWASLSSNDVIIVPYKSYGYCISPESVDKLVIGS